ncbi:uncharacterized protein Z518_02063 [Rhinocladiella mackenziei CBS 650.93]|uniref:Uncharacterized protein n=1 Tax=Rhinocladiella mackenziei CBS 650.93 TaxID=1442369 RepID=A0A0D2JDX7_9EURO|nr:uncharacterized protein Z518_02063 [Rhinocladiella mackenziei CBS 650.93]KIX07410.1 hypothetical protein Z518_02063 [Rhinocladiella mackenziei CBS 650.93]
MARQLRSSQQTLCTHHQARPKGGYGVETTTSTATHAPLDDPFTVTIASIIGYASFVWEGRMMKLLELIHRRAEPDIAETYRTVALTIV